MPAIISAVARNSSSASRCTSALVCAAQTWPDRPRVTVPIVTAAAVPTSASAKTTAGLLPPSSRLTRLQPRHAAIMIFWPTARLPVNDSLSTIGWLISASPVGSPGPVTTLSTPSGSPASSAISLASRSTANVAYSEGLSTIVQPAASAGATFWANSGSGAFHGITAPTTPTGSRSVKTMWSPPWNGGSVSPASLSAQPA